MKASLTNDQLESLNKLIWEGKSVREIAELLEISKGIVNYHTRHVRSETRPITMAHALRQSPELMDLVVTSLSHPWIGVLDFERLARTLGYSGFISELYLTEYCENLEFKKSKPVNYGIWLRTPRPEVRDKGLAWYQLEKQGALVTQCHAYREELLPTLSADLSITVGSFDLSDRLIYSDSNDSSRLSFRIFDIKHRS